jgi:hypothetical protein
MPVRIDTITMDCRDEQILNAFWTAALGYEVAADQPGDWAEGESETEIRRLEGLGARRVRYVENDPDESHWIMAGPEGNELCCERPP